MHPFIRAYLNKMHLERTGVLWFDCRDEWQSLYDSAVYMIEQTGVKNDKS